MYSLSTAWRLPQGLDARSKCYLLLLIVSPRRIISLTEPEETERTPFNESIPLNEQN